MNQSANATQAAIAPEVQWAQRKDKLFLTLMVKDCKSPSIELTASKLTFKGKDGSKEYQVDLEFNKDVDPEKSQQRITGRNIYFELMKTEESSSWWPRLLKDSSKRHWLKTDFNKWKDEDDTEDEAEEPNNFDMESMMQSMGGLGGMGGMGGMPGGMGGMGGMPGGMGGMGGMPDMSGLQGGDSDDSDDEDLPDLQQS